MNVSYINRLYYSRGFFFRQTFLKPLMNIHQYPWGLKYKIDSSEPRLLKDKSNQNALASQNAEANVDTREVGPSSKKLNLGPTKVDQGKKATEGQKGTGLSVEESFGVVFYSSEDEEMEDEDIGESLRKRKKEEKEGYKETNHVMKKQRLEIETSSDSDSSMDFFIID